MAIKGNVQNINAILQGLDGFSNDIPELARGQDESLGRLHEIHFEDLLVVISSLNTLSEADILIIQEYLCLRDSGFDQSTAYSFLNGRHQKVEGALGRLQEAYAKQAETLLAQKHKKRSRSKQPLSEPETEYLGVAAYMKEKLHYGDTFSGVKSPGIDFFDGEELTLDSFKNKEIGKVHTTCKLFPYFSI